MTDFPSHSIKQIVNQASTVVILGFGTTGQAATKFFSNRGVRVIVIEQKSRDQFLLKPSQKKLVSAFEKSGVIFSFSDSIPPAVSKVNHEGALCVISPGIPRNSPAASAIKKLKIPIVGELELGVELSQIPSIMVSGSNGKSTCVSLIHSMLEHAGIRSFLGGNIGNPVLALLDGVQVQEAEDAFPSRLATVLVIEASSYQLESAKSIKPKVSLLLNISENHLERHGSIENYFKAKLMITHNQTESDFCILNADDQRIFAARSNLKSSVALFGQREQTLQTEKNHALIRYDTTRGIDQIIVSLADDEKKIVFDCSHSKLIGEHARYNIASAILAVLLFNQRSITAELIGGIQKSIDEFEGLAHRLQVVPTHSGFLAINDSKSTTVASTVAAVTSVTKAFPARPIVLLLGGKVKVGSWKALAELILGLGDTVRVICFGGDGLFIQQDLQSLQVPAYLAKNVAIAVTYACDWSRENELVLFSPGCASFDEFTNFEERGEFFSKVIGLR